MNDCQEERGMKNRRKRIWRTCVLTAHTLPLLCLLVYHVTLSSVLLSFEIYRLMLRTKDAFVSSVNSRSRFLEFPFQDVLEMIRSHSHFPLIASARHRIGLIEIYNRKKKSVHKY
jgi:hypothetical protein